MQVKKGIRAEEVLQTNKHVVFVEGKGADAIDPNVLRNLLGEKVQIRPLGASFSVKSVAEALFPHHPTYYFVVDRDHFHTQSDVECYWENFPNPETHNLLVWKRRELENYFIDPKYLGKSEYFKGKMADLSEMVLKLAQERLLLDVVNYVLVCLREEQKHTWIEVCRNPAEFPNKSGALEKLQILVAGTNRVRQVEECVCPKMIEQQFTSFWQTMTGGKDSLAFGYGDWLNMVQGKSILGQLINSEHFKLNRKDGNVLQGKEKLKKVVESLLKTVPLSEQPQDFQKLKGLIDKRIQST